MHLAIELTPPIILVPPPIARPCGLLNVPVAVDAIPLLRVVRQRQRILRRLSVEETAAWVALDHEVFAARCRDVDVGGVGAAPGSDLGAVLVDDGQLPFGGVGDGFETVGGCGWWWWCKR